MDDLAVLLEQVHLLDSGDVVDAKTLQGVLKALVVGGGRLVDGLLLLARNSEREMSGKRTMHRKQQARCNQGAGNMPSGNSKHASCNSKRTFLRTEPLPPVRTMACIRASFSGFIVDEFSVEGSGDVKRKPWLVRRGRPCGDKGASLAHQ